MAAKPRSVSGSQRGGLPGSRPSRPSAWYTCVGRALMRTMLSCSRVSGLHANNSNMPSRRTTTPATSTSRFRQLIRTPGMKGLASGECNV
ncbi:MAG: hypothetical protein IIA66_02875 [Planctomycetes bacterium]|nr:hypothetical protein [Planctomycetota bacterium]